MLRPSYQTSFDLVIELLGSVDEKVDLALAESVGLDISKCGLVSIQNNVGGLVLLIFRPVWDSGN